MALSLCEKIEITCRCSDLKDDDVLSKSDPFVVVRSALDQREVGRTETIQNSLNPSFTKHIIADYLFETKQSMTAEVWDFDSDGEHDLIGKGDFTMGQLMSAKNSTLTLKLQPKGTITLIGLHQGRASGTVVLTLRGKQLKNMDTFGKSDPFAVVSRILPDGSFEQLYKTEVIDNNLEPTWKTLPMLELSKLCGGSLDDKNIAIQVFDEDVTENELIGVCKVSLRELCSGNELRLLDTSSNAAGYVIARAELSLRHNFLSLIKSGLQLNIAFSIDFTGSNLDPKMPKSLHYYHPTQPNQYVQAMIAVSDVVQEYDSDKQFPAFGFGAILPGTQELNDFFPLCLGAPTPYLPGMQAVINTYVQTVQQVRFYGPTNFAPTIRNIVSGSTALPGVYTILLIITDGEITDLNAAIAEIKNASRAPVSILIVGVGDADFSSMDRLDGDGGAKIGERDLVQFVAMRDYANRPHSDLAAALLAEIPDQVVKWAALNPQLFPPPQLLPPAPSAGTL